MTIDGIEIERVQSHEHTIIEPSKKVTVIKGTSHAGKSSIVRALKKLIENRPMGREGLLSWFADNKDTMSIGMSFEEGTYVYRNQAHLDNNYTTSGSKTPYRALRSDVPEDVYAITRMNSVNIQSQHDPYFMLQSSPGEVGRMFNEAVGLEIIDEAISQAKKAFNTVNAQRVACYKQVEDLEEELVKYENLDEVGKLVAEVEEDGMRVSIMRDQRTKLATYMDELQVLEGDIGITKEFLKLEKDRRDLYILAAIVNKKTLRKQQLQADVLEYKMTARRIDINEQWMEIEEFFIEIWEIAQSVSKLKSERIQLKRTVRDIKRIKATIQIETDALTDIRKQIYKLLQKTKLCPFCYSTIGDDTIQHICERRGWV
jgi:chromosome segregation ATPase